NGLAFSPDGRTLAASTNHGTLSSWEWDPGRDTIRPRWAVSSACNRMMNSVAFSSDGSSIATGGTCAELWDAGTGRLRRTLGGEQGYVNALAFCPDGLRLAALHLPRGVVVLWDADGLRRAGIFQGRSCGLSLAFAPGGRTLATGTQDGTIELWAVRPTR